MGSVGPGWRVWRRRGLGWADWSRWAWGASSLPPPHSAQPRGGCGKSAGPVRRPDNGSLCLRGGRGGAPLFSGTPSRQGWLRAVPSPGHLAQGYSGRLKEVCARTCVCVCCWSVTVCTEGHVCLTPSLSVHMHALHAGVLCLSRLAAPCIYCVPACLPGCVCSRVSICLQMCLWRRVYVVCSGVLRETALLCQCLHLHWVSLASRRQGDSKALAFR